MELLLEEKKLDIYENKIKKKIVSGPEARMKDNKKN